MRIWQKLLLGLLVIAGSVILVISVSTSLSVQIGQLRSVELPMEQNLREVEVSIWKTIHAANAFRATGDPHYSDLYAAQVRNVDNYFPVYFALTDSEVESRYAAEFQQYWSQAKVAGNRLIEIVQRQKNAQDEFFSVVDEADDVIDAQIQDKLSSMDPNVLAKERAVREVEVSIWEAIHAAEQYAGLTQTIKRAGHAQKTFAELMKRQFQEVKQYWETYKSLCNSAQEQKPIREFEALWSQGMQAGDKVVALYDQASEQFDRLFEKIGAADGIIDIKMQRHIQARIRKRDQAARQAKFLTAATGLATVIGATLICLLITRSIAVPMRSLVVAADEFSKGNLSHRIDDRRTDELGELTRAFDRMGHELKTSADRIAREVAEREQAEQAAHDAREFLEAALANSPSGILIADAPDVVIRLANRAAVEIHGGDRDDLTGVDIKQHAQRWRIYRSDGSPYPAEQLPLSRAVLHGESVQDEEFIIRDRSGRDRWISANAAPLRDGESRVTAGIVVFHDVSERKMLMTQMQELAFHDALTGLPNRASILLSIQSVIDRDSGSHFALLYLDFDRFKLVNDSLGHEMGDVLLKEISARLRKTLRTTDSVFIPARIGGDEFVVLLDELSSPADATVVAQRLLQVFSQSYDLAGQTAYSTASIGIVTSDHGFDSASEMLRDADLAMYESKAAGKACYTVFDQNQREKVQTRLRIENEMRDGIERNEFGLVYQPIISLQTGEITGAEALLRWTHPQRGVIGAAEFIPVAEETGMIITIGRQIIHEACRQLARWQNSPQADGRPLCVHVNVSRKQLLPPNLASIVEQALVDNGVMPQGLHLEVTESAVMDDPQTAIAVLSQLRRLGVKIDIDDFGTGYSSLYCIHEFPIDVLKIDRAFIANVRKTHDSRALLQAVLTLADNLKLKVVAEGIEDIGQLTMLQELGCQFGQGYLFARPMSSAEFEGLLGSTFEITQSTSKVKSPPLNIPFNPSSDQPCDLNS